MPTDVAWLVVAGVALVGALAVFGIGAAFTRKLSVLACSGAASGAALGALAYVLCGWFKHGFDWLQLWVLPLAALILLVVMAAQNWFVFYEDNQDALQSSRPAVVVLAGAIVSIIAAILSGAHSLFFPAIWASAGSLAILLCIEPVQRSIERNRRVGFGTLIGICKVLIPVTGITLFLQVGAQSQIDRQPADTERAAGSRHSLFFDLLGLMGQLGRLVLVTLVNGPRMPPPTAAVDPWELPWKPHHEQSVTGDMPRLKRDSVVLILVLAIHVLCGLIIIKGWS